MIDVKYWASNLIERKGEGPADVSALGYLTLSVVKVCRLAAGNETTVEQHPTERLEAVSQVLEIAEALIGMAIDGAEQMEHPKI